MRTSRIRFKIRRIQDGKFLFPLKYSGNRRGYWDDRSGLIWNNTGRLYISEKAAKNELDRINLKKHSLEIIKVQITEEFEISDNSLKLSFFEWLQVFENK